MTPRRLTSLLLLLTVVAVAMLFSVGPIAAQSVSVTDVAVTSRPASGDTYRSGETIQVTVLFSEAVNVTGVPSMVFFMDRGNVMYPGYTSQGGSPNRLIFEVSLTGDNLNKTKLDGISIQGRALTYRNPAPGGRDLSQSGTIRDAAGNDANRSIPSHLWIENAGGHKVDTRPSDHTALVALYNATNGGNWGNNTNWLSNQPLGEWHGVTTDSAGRVTKLDLKCNNLTGSLPAAVGSLASLASLNLIGNCSPTVNRLTGEIPAELGRLSNLRRLVLDGNRLSGPIPPELGRLSNLTHLTMHTNRLSGPIPPELGRLSNLTHLSLSGNQLSGAIPRELGGLSNLEELWLSRNSGLSGPLPGSFTRACSH